MTEPGVDKRHVFISYAREDSASVDRLSRAIETVGIPVWHDIAELMPGQSRATGTRSAIRSASVLIVCFSRRSTSLTQSHQNEELLFGVEQLRLRRPDSPWLIPVRFDDCMIPDVEIGAGRSLDSIQSVDLFGPGEEEGRTRLIAAVRRLISLPDSLTPLNELYALDQQFVANSIMALREGAREMLRAGMVPSLRFGDEELDILGPEIPAELNDLWDVLQNYAEAVFPGPVNGLADLREIINVSYDPTWRLALRAWADQNPNLVDGPAYGYEPVFDYAARIELDSYVAAFAEPSQLLEAALASGRLPCDPSLVAESPEVARLCMGLWRLTSAASPLRAIDVSPEPVHAEIIDDESIPDESPAARSRTLGRRPRSDQHAVADRQAKSVLDVLGHLFLLDGKDDRRLRTELRRQRGGTRPGANISFRARDAVHNSVCLVEYRNYDCPVPVGAVNGVVEADAAFEVAPIDHWILISPLHDPSEGLKQAVGRWNHLGKFPFTVQIWSPQTNVSELFGLDPMIYRDLYGADPPQERHDTDAIKMAFADRLRPPTRLPRKLAAYLGDVRSFVEPKEVGWLEQLDSQIERFGFDEKGVRLPRPLQDEIMARLLDPRSDSNVALLIADFGEGKSFFTVSLCASLRTRYFADPLAGRPIPIRLMLRGYRHFTSPIEFLRSQLEQVGLSMEEWPELMRLKILVVLDGLDEISVRQDPVTTRANLDKIGSLFELLEDVPVLVTSRPHFFASVPDRERFYDRLRRPHVFWMGQPDRRETVAHLRAFADTPALAQKLNKIKELYDPIGLAGKVLFLEMIKVTLPDLPEDRFDEIVLYETYVDRSLRRKIQLLREVAAPVHDSELLADLKILLEKIAVAIHISGEGSVDLRQFVADAGGAARLLWRASESEDLHVGANEDATARIGGRSLLRRLSDPVSGSDGGWIVDFFHRSMKEYFTAKALQRALNFDDPFVATRRLLIHTPMQSEILGFFRLLAVDPDVASPVLASLAHSARLGSRQGFLGGGAMSLLSCVGNIAGADWKALDLDGALLAGADLSGCDFRESTLRGADLSQANLTDADMRGADLTDANLAAGNSVIAFSQDTTPHRYLCLTPDAEIGRISIKADDSLVFSSVRMPQAVRAPRAVFALAEDVVLIAAQAEFVIAEIGAAAADEAARFRVSNDITAVTVLSRSQLGLLIESELGHSEALLADIESGQVVWRVPVISNGLSFGWSENGILIAHENGMTFFDKTGSAHAVHIDIIPSGPTLSMRNDKITMLTQDARAICIRTDGLLESSTAPLHNGIGTAMIATGTAVLTAGSDGSLALVRTDDAGALVEVARLERRLRCSGAKVDRMKREHERSVFVANGAKYATTPHR